MTRKEIRKTLKDNGITYSRTKTDKARVFKVEVCIPTALKGAGKYVRKVAEALA